MPIIQVKDFFYDVRAMLDEYNDGGEIIADTEVADIEANLFRFMNMSIREAYKETKIYAKHQIDNRAYPNLIGSAPSGFEAIDFIGEDQNYPSDDGVIGATAYFFTATEDFTVYIEENIAGTWTTKAVISEVITVPTDYKDLITPTDSNNAIRMRFSGTTFYRHLNRCLYSYPFKVDSIPDYREWVRHELPDDFGILDEVVTETYGWGSNNTFANTPNYKWEGRKTIIINYEWEGILTVIYKPIAPILTDKEEYVPIDDPLVLQFCEYKAASKVAFTENNKLVDFLNQLADEALYKSKPNTPAGKQDIEDVYGMDEVIW